MPRVERFPVIVGLVGLLVVALGLALGSRLIRGDGSLIEDAAMAHVRITPNADGADDATPLHYELSRSATISIYFEDVGGERHYFRKDQPRGAGEYEVLFSGVVAGYELPGESFAGEILARLLQNGVYTWVVEAVDDAGHTERRQGELTIAEADTELPVIRDLSLSSREFTPNQDGIGDRVQIDFFIPKDVATLRVYLRMPDGTEVQIPERPDVAQPNARGRHLYDWAGGVDQNASPPPDGTYPVVAYAADAEGQKYRVVEAITIELGGLPFANIISPVSGNTLAFSTTAVEICGTITFTVTVENYGDAPIRTVGPWSGAIYDSHWNYNTMGWPTESGAWRLGIGYENALGDYPYRWGLGSPETLTEIDGNYYLMPGERAVVRGGIRVVDRFGVRNPQPMWAGLIHEDVQIAAVNNRVDTQLIQVDIPAGVEAPECEERTAPVAAAER